MDFLYNIFNERTVIVTWDTLHIFLTLSIFIALMIFIWITRLNPCENSIWDYEDINPDKGIPRCLDPDKSMSICLYEAC